MQAPQILDERFKDPRFTHAMLNRLPEYLAGQRWFTSKGKEIVKCSIEDSHTVSEDTALVVIRVDFADKSKEFYQMPLAQLDRVEDQKKYLKCTPKMILLRVPGGPIIVDAVPLPAFRRALYEMIRNGVDTSDGITCECGKLLRRAPETMDSVVPSIDTSNTAIIYGDKYFFKLFRKLDPGLNPDLELVRYLSEKTDFANCPPYGGSLGVGKMTDPNYLNLGMLSGKVDNRGDAWEYFQELTARYFAGDGEVDEETIRRARLLGQRTAEMHHALTKGTGDMLKPAPLTAEYRSEITFAAQKLLSRQVAELRTKASGLEPEMKAAAQRVLDLEPALNERLASLSGQEMELDLIRIHADYHLGQVLVTDDDFVIIDFEGEPLLSIPERRRRRPALKDVAGMVRSFHYAANAQLLLNPETYAGRDQAVLTARANEWYETVSAAYLAAYFDACGEATFLPAAEADRKTLLDLFVLEKAIYEVAYELNSRPAWLGVPLGGVLGVAG
ncbi:phosphotransferase [Neolewinella aurantiaca]|uniref:Maltokinase n=1 Tax=Neolewinella aurantiaca TaxID=2602767 RepID=A0A5C7FH89_9BACT|nr:phosphotransferase [Neolewinella aurantiaca]TXF89796.1 phosphotransferase [Neolewinella aurantiaca]